MYLFVQHNLLLGCNMQELHNFNHARMKLNPCLFTFGTAGSFPH